jgi:hypothetical protein
MTYLPPRVTAVATKGEFPPEEIIHAEMEEDDIPLRAIPEMDGSVDAQVHIAVDGGIVMADK